MAGTPSIGCAFLARPDSFTSGGWACLADGEPFRFSSVETLAARGQLWVLNAPFDRFLTESGPSYPFLRHSKFLPTPVAGIAQELGAADTAADQMAASRTAEVLGRVLRHANTLIPGVASLGNLAGHDSLISALQEKIAAGVRHDELPQDIEQNLPSMMRSQVRISPSSSPGAKEFAVRVPANRVELMRLTMASSVPSGAWRELDLKDYPNPQAALSAVVGDQMPAICLVSIKGIDARLKGISPQLKHTTSGHNVWLTGPDLVAFSRIFEMVPRKIYVAESLAPAPSSVRVMHPELSAWGSASISAALLCETYLHAVMGDLQPSASEGRSDAKPTMRSTWLHSVARSYMLQEAMALAEQGIRVSEYGSSHLIVAVQKRNLDHLRKCLAASSLLAYPTYLLGVEKRIQVINEAQERALAIRALEVESD